mgnify:CR=1 FL=1
MFHSSLKDLHNNNTMILMVGLLAINVFWGASFVANEIALRTIGPIEIATIRFLIAAPLLAVLTYLWKGPEIFKINRKDIKTLIILAITGVTVQYVLQVTAQDYTTATNASLLINTSVFFIMFLSSAFLGEKMSMLRITGATIGFAGVALLVSKGSLAFDIGGHVLGDGMIIICAFLWAIYSIYSKKISGRYHPLTILNYVFILGTIGFIPFYLMIPHGNVTDIPADALISILFLALFCSIIAYIIYNMALEKMQASTVAVYIYFVPLSTIVFAAILLNETLTTASGIGAALVLLGMYLAQK